MPKMYLNPRSKISGLAAIGSIMTFLCFSAIALVAKLGPLPYGPSNRSILSSVISFSMSFVAVCTFDSSS
jgi:hypothetical protein